MIEYIKLKTAKRQRPGGVLFALRCDWFLSFLSCCLYHLFTYFIVLFTLCIHRPASKLLFSSHATVGLFIVWAMRNYVAMTTMTLIQAELNRSFKMRS